MSSRFFSQRGIEYRHGTADPKNATVDSLVTLLAAGLLAAGVTAGLTPLVIAAAHRWRIVDRPGGRRIHQAITPRLGGVAVLVGFFTVFTVFLPELAPNFKPKQLLGFAVAAALLLVVGILDDKRGLPAWLQLSAQLLAGVILVLVGMGIEEVTHPLGGKLALDQFEYPIAIGGVDHFLTLPADLITVAWVVLVINAVNFLDGLDGLATGVGAITAFTLALLSLSAAVSQPFVALLAVMLGGALIGFLLYNWHPAKIFLGTVGSTFVGFTIATLAIISGGKIATAVLVLGFPILDALVIITRRSLVGGVPWRPDARHLHHQLLAAGLSVRQAVLVIYIVSAIFGGLALLAGTTGQKAVAFGLLLFLMAFVLAALGYLEKQRVNRQT